MSSAKRPLAENPSKSVVKKNTFHLVLCVLGIYASFLSWAVLQERVATTAYGEDSRIFRASNVINCIQSVLAFISGYVLLKYQSRKTPMAPLIPRSSQVVKYYLFIAACQTLSSPFAYASLKYVDYVSMLLAKSCKLLPVMAVHILLYQTRYPLYKYLVVALVTAGVCVFSIFNPSTQGKSGLTDTSDRMWGMFLLSINLLLDGLYNTTQDQMFKKFGKFGLSGTHMMTTMNFLTGIFAGVCVILSRTQLAEATWFARHHPAVYRDIFLFGMCGAIGQVFIFLTLEKFGSLVLVTTTVTRKMISMLLSVVMFGHQLVALQWVGVAMVFCGVIAEAMAKKSSNSDTKKNR